MEINGKLVDIEINEKEVKFSAYVCVGIIPANFHHPQEELSEEHTKTMDLDDFIEFFDYDCDIVYPNDEFSVEGAIEFIKNNLTEKIEEKLLDYLQTDYDDYAQARYEDAMETLSERQRDERD